MYIHIYHYLLNFSADFRLFFLCFFLFLGVSKNRIQWWGIPERRAGRGSLRLLFGHHLNKAPCTKYLVFYAFFLYSFFVCGFLLFFFCQAKQAWALERSVNRADKLFDTISGLESESEYAIGGNTLATHRTHRKFFRCQETLEYLIIW